MAWRSEEAKRNDSFRNQKEMSHFLILTVRNRHVQKREIKLKIIWREILFIFLFILFVYLFFKYFLIVKNLSSNFQLTPWRSMSTRLLRAYYQGSRTVRPGHRLEKGKPDITLYFSRPRNSDIIGDLWLWHIDII